MLLTLMKKECVQYLKSVTYYIFCICLALDFFTQMGEFDVPPKPEEGWESYGYVRTTDKDLIMQETLNKLWHEYSAGSYTTYPIGFYKRVQLDEAEEEMIAEIITNCTGMTKEEFSAFEEEEKNIREAAMEKMLEEQSMEPGMILENDLPELDIPIKEGLAFDDFCQEMKKADNLLGGGSSYSEAELQFTTRPQTYEEALEEYNSFIKKDKITNAYARLFCDYMGIMLAMLPVFLAVGRVLRDRRAQAEQVIHMKSASSFSIVLSRYLAAVLMSLIPVLVLSCCPLLQCIYYADRIGEAYDLFAFVRHIGFWLLPYILITLSVGFFITEITDSVAAVLIQGIWWFVSVFMSIGNLVGLCGWNLVPRFNSVGDYPIYEQMKEQLFKNRLMYTAVSIVLLLLTVLVYSKKRKGEFASVRARFVNRKNKLEV